jgi:sirohydrochlorin ferrochelatase
MNEVTDDMKRNKHVLTALFLLMAAFFSAFAPGGAAGGKTGVLVIAHGSNETGWNQVVQQGVAGVRLPYPIAVGFLEFTEPGIQKALTQLETQGVNRIIAVPLFVSTYSNHIEEIKYVLRLRNTLPRPEGVFGEHSVSGHTDEALRQIQSHCQIILTPALDDQAIVAGILSERLKTISRRPDREVAVLVGHGADSAAGEVKWRAQFASLARQVKKDLKLKNARYGFAAMGKPTARQAVTAAVAEGEALVVAVMLSEGFFTDRKIPHDLEGLQYRYPQRGSRALLPHPDLARFIELRVGEVVKNQK